MRTLAASVGRRLQHGQDVFGRRGEQPSFAAVTTLYAIPRHADGAPPPWRFRNELADEADALAARRRERGFAPASAPPEASVRPYPGWGFEGGPAEAATRLEHVPVPLGSYSRVQCICRGRLLLWGVLNDELLCVDVPKTGQVRPSGPCALECPQMAHVGIEGLGRVGGRGSGRSASRPPLRRLRVVGALSSCPTALAPTAFVGAISSESPVSVSASECRAIAEVPPLA